MFRIRMVDGLPVGHDEVPEGTVFLTEPVHSKPWYIVATVEYVGTGDVVTGPEYDVENAVIRFTRSAAPAGMTPPRLVASAFGVTPLPDQFDMALEGPFNLIGAMYLDVGLYYLLFGDVQPDSSYFVIPSDGATRIAAVEKGADYILLQATDPDGAAKDPASFNIQIYRL